MKRFLERIQQGGNSVTLIELVIVITLIGGTGRCDCG